MNSTYYDRDGHEIEKPMQGFEYRVCAKKLVGEQMVRFFISTANGKFMDPRKYNDRQMKTYISKMKEVGSEVFEKYVQYLQGKTRVSLTSIERMI